MANYDPDKEMFDAVKEGIKNLTDTLTKWQQKETAIHSLAEVNAKNSGAPAEQMDAHVYMHKKALKKAMSEQSKQMNEGVGGPGVPTAQDRPGDPNFPGQGGPGMAPMTPQAPATSQTGGVPSAATSVSRNTPTLPMADQHGNTGANGWSNILKPSPYPPVAQAQQGAPMQSTGPVTPAQHPMPGMPVPPVQGGFTAPNTMRPHA